MGHVSFQQCNHVRLLRGSSAMDTRISQCSRTRTTLITMLPTLELLLLDWVIICSLNLRRTSEPVCCRAYNHLFLDTVSPVLADIFRWKDAEIMQRTLEVPGGGTCRTRSPPHVLPSQAMIQLQSKHRVRVVNTWHDR